MNLQAGVLFGVLFASTAVFGQGTPASRLVISPTFSLYSSVKEQGTERQANEAYDVDSSSDSEVNYLNLQIGYLTGSNLFFGISYLDMKISLATSDTDNTGSEPMIQTSNNVDNHNGVGIAVGYMSANLKLIATYFLSYESYLDIDGTYEQGPIAQTVKGQSEADGEQAFAVDLAYGYNMGSLTIGPQFTYLKLVYSGYQDEYVINVSGSEYYGLVDYEGGYSEVRIIPSLTLWYTF